MQKGKDGFSLLSTPLGQDHLFNSAAYNTPLPVTSSVWSKFFAANKATSLKKKNKKCFIDRRVSYKDESGNVTMSTWIDGTERRLSGLFIQSEVIKLTVAVLNMEWKE